MKQGVAPWEWEPVASFDGRVGLSEVGSLAPVLGGTTCTLQALPVWWLREPWAIAKCLGVTIGTKPAMRKLKEDHAKPEQEESEYYFSTMVWETERFRLPLGR